MGAYKKLNKQDAYITSRTAHKTISLINGEYEGQGVVIKYASGSLYNSIKQLYYPSMSEGNIASHSYDYYEQTTLYNPDTRIDFTSSSLTDSGSLVVSIPRSLYGTYIKPGYPFEIILFNMVQAPYIVDEYDYWPDFSPLSVIKWTAEQDYVFEKFNETVTIRDDEEGGLYIYGTNPKKYVGDIIYSHGILVITDPAIVAGLETSQGRQSQITWDTSHPIFTHTYHCRLRESEFNHTYNRSALKSRVGTKYWNDGDIYNISTGSIIATDYNSGEKQNNITGSAFQPYITTVGLYNDANELIAVGKLGQPIPKSANTEMTIVVKIDI